MFPSYKGSPQHSEQMSALSLTCGRQEQRLIDHPCDYWNQWQYVEKERLPSLYLVCLGKLNTPGPYNHFRKRVPYCFSPDSITRMS